MCLYFQVTELVTCSCRRCHDTSCQCPKYGFVCTDACSCRNCSNTNEDDDESESEFTLVSDDSDDEMI